MSKLPPGFTHELRHHLTHKVPEVDPLTGAPVLPLEEFCCGSHRRLLVAGDSITEITSVAHLRSRSWFFRFDCARVCVVNTGPIVDLQSYAVRKRVAPPTQPPASRFLTQVPNPSPSLATFPVLAHRLRQLNAW